MPKGSRPSKTQIALLTHLPHQSDLTLVGGKRALPVYLREQRQTFQPELILWIDEQSGYIRASRMTNPLSGDENGGVEALEALIDACTGPFLLPQPPAPVELDIQPGGKRNRKASPRPPLSQPALPARICITDAALAQAARAIFEPRGVAVEYVEQSPLFDNVFTELADSMSEEMESEPPQPFEWEIDPALLPALYKAAAGMWRRAPWEYMPDHPPVAIALGDQGPEPGVSTIYASILGAGGEVTGLAFYYSLDAFAKTLTQGAELRAPISLENIEDEDVDLLIGMLRQIGAPVDALPPDELRAFVGETLAQETAQAPENPWDISPDGMVCFFDPQDTSDVMYLEWLEDHQLKYPSRDAVPTFLKTQAQSEPRRPNERETRALTLAIESLNQFFSRNARLLDDPFSEEMDTLTSHARITDGAQTTIVDVTFPPPGYDLDDEFDDEDDEGDDEDIIGDEDE